MRTQILSRQDSALDAAASTLNSGKESSFAYPWPRFWASIAAFLFPRVKRPAGQAIVYDAKSGLPMARP
jgi:hypothetical protein